MFNTQRFSSFLSDDSGAMAIEYGLIAAGIGVAILVAVQVVGTALNDKFAAIETKLK